MVHVGFYDAEVGEGIYESHMNFFIAASNAKSAKKKTFNLEQFKNKEIDILVATPGRMFDLVSQGHINLSRIQILILDEADHMLNLGFFKDIKDILRHILMFNDPKWQFLLL